MSGGFLVVVVVVWRVGWGNTSKLRERRGIANEGVDRLGRAEVGSFNSGGDNKNHQRTSEIVGKGWRRPKEEK